MQINLFIQENTRSQIFLRFNLEPSCQIQRVVFPEYRSREWVRCFGAVLVSVRWGLAAYRGPTLAGLWQKWGFHARLVANAVLLIWPASKGPGRSLDPTSASSPTDSPLAPPARLGSLPSFWASTHVWMQQCCSPPVPASSSFNALPSPLHSPLLIQQYFEHVAHGFGALPWSI